MATEIRDSLFGRKEAAVQLLREAMNTPFLVEMEFTIHMGVDMADEAEYTIRRFVGPVEAEETGTVKGGKRNGQEV